MRSILFVILSLAIMLSFSQPVICSEVENKELVERFIKAVASGDKKAIADLISYPLYRPEPLSDIENPDQFIKAFDEIFDEKFLNAISKSHVSDWDEVGYRGILFQNGDIWLDDEGKVKCIYYETEISKKIQKDYLESVRKKLHSSIQNFKNPMLEFTTKDYRIRIDRMYDGSIRFASWSVSKQTSEKPDLILNNGDMIPEGSGGNHHYDFKNGPYLYRCIVTRLFVNHDDPALELEVYKKAKLILYQPIIEPKK